MKNKILLRLILYFVTSFIVFAMIIGIVFSTLFSQHNIEVHKGELERHAVSVAGTLSAMLEGGASPSMGRGMMRHGMGLGMHRGMGMMNLAAYLQFVEDIVQCSVWVVDRDLEQINFGGRHMQTGLAFRDLPGYAEQVIANAFDGVTSTGEHFSELLGTPSITAAAPITAYGEIIGVVLLHYQVSDVNMVTQGGLTLLIFSMGGAIVISIFVAAWLSSRFTRPLNQMKAAALQISDGDYTAKTGVSQTDEIGQLAAVLDKMADKLEQASGESAKLEQLRRDFVANISHELRTPITVIRGSLEALLDGVVTDDSKVRGFHSQMHVECKHLERLVSDLLDLSRLQNTDFAIEATAIDLRDVAEDAARTMARLAQQKEVNINLAFEGNDFPTVGDYGRLRQMLIIVLDNAIKFSLQGGEVLISLRREGSFARIAIRDHGLGIPTDEVGHIFERFYKQRSEQNKAGTGLGLSIAKQIAKRHGIAIEAYNHSEGGAIFALEIPLTLPV